MTRWLKNIIAWLANLLPKEEDYSTYHPKERLIFSYWNGSKTIHADPLVLFKRLSAKGPELSVDMSLSLSESKDADKGHDGAVRKIREIFQLKIPPDEAGIDASECLTETEAIQLFDQFLLFNEQLKKNSNQLPTSSSSSEDSQISSQRSRPTGNSTDSGSAAVESSTAVPEPSHTA